MSVSTVGQLDHGLKRRHLTMIGIGGAVGTGLFVGSASAIRSTGPAAIVSYAVAGLLVMFVMRMLGEMVVAQPMAGSFSDYARLALGRWAGFTIGWLYWYAYVVIVAVEAVAGGAVVHSWLPEVPPWLLSLVLLAIMTGVNLTSVKSFGDVEFWFALVKVAAIVTFLALGGAYVLGLWPGHRGPDLSNLVSHGGFAPRGIVAVLGSIVTVIFAFGGTEVVTFAAAESAEPGLAVAKATRNVMWRIVGFFLGSIFLVVAIVPWDTLDPVVSPYVVALEQIGIPLAATAMTIVILTALLSVLNSMLYASSRLLYALSQHNDAPRALVKLNRRRVPARAILLATSVGYLSVLAQHFWPDQVLDFLISSCGAVMIFMYLVIAFSQLRLRTRLAPEEAARLSFKMWCFPYLTYAVIVALIAVLCAMAIFDETRPQLLASAFSVGVVLLMYAVWTRRSEQARR